MDGSAADGLEKPQVTGLTVTRRITLRLAKVSVAGSSPVVCSTMVRSTTPS